MPENPTDKIQGWNSYAEFHLVRRAVDQFGTANVSGNHWSFDL